MTPKGVPKSKQRSGSSRWVGARACGVAWFRYETRAFMDAQLCMAYEESKYEVLCGREEMTAQALSVASDEG